MSLIFIECDSTDIPIGFSVVIDSTSLKAREYDSKTDTTADIVGVSYPKSGTTGRICANFDGLGFNDYDYFTFGEDLQYISPLTPNPNFAAFDPVNSTSPYYCCLCILGMVAVENTQIVPSSWKKIRIGTTYDVYLVK